MYKQHDMHCKIRVANNTVQFKVINTCGNGLEIFLSNIVAGPKVPLSKEVLNIVIVRHHLQERRF